jgi:hypothetical protein
MCLRQQTKIRPSELQTQKGGHGDLELRPIIHLLTRGAGRMTPGVITLLHVLSPLGRNVDRWVGQRCNDDVVLASLVQVGFLGYFERRYDEVMKSLRKSSVIEREAGSTSVYVAFVLGQ